MFTEADIRGGVRRLFAEAQLRARNIIAVESDRDAPRAIRRREPKVPNERRRIVCAAAKEQQPDCPCDPR